MTTNKINLKTKFISILLALVFVLSSCGFLSALTSKKQVLANDRTSISITNANFNDDVVSGNIVSPTGWSKVDAQNNVISGIISLDQEIFDKQKTDSYKLSFKPYSYLSMPEDDEQVLMLNAQNEKLNMGYQSENITLEKNSYYELSFMALTEKADYSVIASANFTNNDVLNDSVISIVTNGNWVKYTFLIETSKISSIDTNLELWLGFSNGVQSYGAVFFDNIECYQLSESAYKTILNANSGNSNYYFISLNQSVNDEQFENSDFENSTLTGWEALLSDGYSVASANNYAGLINFNSSNASAYKLDSMPKDANLSNNSQALLLNNKTASAVGYKSSAITIKQYHYYKISVLAKTNISSGSAYINLIELNPYDDKYDDDSFGVKSFNLAVDTTSSTSESTNDWIEYSYFIKGRSFEDTSVYLELCLGSGSESSLGYAMFDNIVVYEISYNEYTSGVSQSNSLEADFTSSYTATTIENGTFDLVKSDGKDSTYPYSPLSWTKSTSQDNSTLSGVINTKDTSMFNQFANPTSSHTYSNNNNVLMLGNLGANAQTFTTENTFSLEASSFYKLSFKVQTQNLTNGATAGFKLYTDSLTLKQLMFIESNGSWTTYTIYIKTGLNSYTCNVELSLGSAHNGSGFAFFDDIILVSTTESAYNSANKSNTYKVNLVYDDFTNINETKTDGVYSSNSVTSSNLSSTQNVLSGVINPLDQNAMSGLLTGEVSPNLPTDSDGNKLSGNALIVKSNSDANYTLTTKETFTLSSGSFYKISVWVLTRNLSQQDENKTKISGTSDYYPFGATIKLTNLDKTFSGIDTQNEWVQYSYYINSTDDASVQVVLSLGQTNALTSGTVFFTNLKVEQIEQDDYYTAVAPLENDETITNIMAIGSTKIDDSSDDDDSGDSENFNWLLIPTLITSIALILAIIAIGIRQFVKKHPKKVKLGKLEYNREITLEKDFDQLEKLKANQEKLQELRQQLDQVKIDITQAKQEFKQQEQEHKTQLAKEVKIQKQTKSKSEIKAYSQSRKAELKKLRLERYKARQAELDAKYQAIELEIEAIYKEELRLMQLYKEYKKQVKLKKQELKEQKNQKSE